jgi:hypothetical protein
MRWRGRRRNRDNADAAADPDADADVGDAADDHSRRRRHDWPAGVRGVQRIDQHLDGVGRRGKHRHDHGTDDDAVRSDGRLGSGAPDTLDQHAAHLLYRHVCEQRHAQFVSRIYDHVAVGAGRRSGLLHCRAGSDIGWRLAVRSARTGHRQRFDLDLRVDGGNDIDPSRDILFLPLFDGSADSDADPERISHAESESDTNPNRGAAHAERDVHSTHVEHRKNALRVQYPIEPFGPRGHGGRAGEL